MRERLLTLFAAVLAALLFASACGGGDDDDGDGSTAGQTPSATEAADNGGDEGNDGDDDEPSRSNDGGWTEEDARALLDTMLITPDDVPSVWTIGTDTTSDNAAAATNDPAGGASFERCGRLLGRLLVLQPEDVVTRYVGGETVSFFSQGTVYATDEGATDCSLEAAQRFSNCAELAKAFGGVFIDPAAVSCVPFDYEQVADGSFAVGLTGKISAAGTIVDLTIKVVAWRQGNVAAVVGMAAAFDPVIDELKPLVDLVKDRITEAQS